jgi:hypothetical protein
MTQPASAIQIETADGYDVAKRAEDLCILVPAGLAILPRNFEVASSKEELVYDPHASTIQKLWYEAGLPICRIERSSEHFPRALERTADWIGPTVFIASLLITQNPYAVQIAIGVIQDYASRLFLGRSTSATVKLTVLIETTTAGRVTKKVCYEGDVAGLGKLEHIPIAWNQRL